MDVCNANLAEGARKKIYHFFASWSSGAKMKGNMAYFFLRQLEPIFSILFCLFPC